MVMEMVVAESTPSTYSIYALVSIENVKTMKKTTHRVPVFVTAPFLSLPVAYLVDYNL
jgi:hypothetical protein